MLPRRQTPKVNYAVISEGVDPATNRRRRKWYGQLRPQSVHTGSATTLSATWKSDGAQLRAFTVEGYRRNLTSHRRELGKSKTGKDRLIELDAHTADVLNSESGRRSQGPDGRLRHSARSDHPVLI